MLSRVYSASLEGVGAHIVTVEVDVSQGLQIFRVVGLPEGMVQEGKVRVETAFDNSQLRFPPRRVTVNLSPADLRKVGTGFDLPIAVGILAAIGDVEPSAVEDTLFVGELGFDGRLQPIRGVLPFAIAARQAGFERVILPKANAAEAAVVEGLIVLPAKHLCEVAAHLRGDRPLLVAVAPEVSDDPLEDRSVPDLADVRGQALARRALEVAAAGEHNLLLVGPPGTGKTMLARRLPGLLPPLGFEESLATSRIYSVRGLLPPGLGLLRQRPFRAPHHTISSAALVGGGVGLPRPGELSLAHNGVLFLDELPEFKRPTLDNLRQPMETGSVVIARVHRTLEFPARIMLVAAMNPCPCGYHGDPRGRCSCRPHRVQAYRDRISGPLLDRIDLHVEVPPLPFRQLSDAACGESTATVRARVLEARARQATRWAGLSASTNARVPSGPLREALQLTRSAMALLESAMGRLGLSARSFERILRVARTAADLERRDEVDTPHVAEAIQYRKLDRQGQFGARPRPLRAASV